VFEIHAGIAKSSVQTMTRRRGQPAAIAVAT
jgi:hypothetical protein